MRRMPGIGAKTASQIILDLRGKLVSSTSPVVNNAKMNDVAEALKSLGYRPGEIKPVIRELSKEDLSTDEYIKRALAMLIKKI